MASASTKTTPMILVWLDDNAGSDLQLNQLFLTVFQRVENFQNAESCLTFLNSIESPTPSISVLVSGRFGQQHVPGAIQPLAQVKSIYVFCMDVNRHNQWAQKCDKVRCVASELAKIFEQMQNDENKKFHPAVTTTEQLMSIDNDSPGDVIETFVPNEPSRFLTDENLYDQLALRLILENSDEDEKEHFKTFCQNHNDPHGDDPEKIFRSNRPIKEWFQLDLPLVRIFSNNFDQLWPLRWFIRSFSTKIRAEHTEMIRNLNKFVVHHATWLNENEWEKLKTQLGKTLIFNEFLLGDVDQNEALKSVQPASTDSARHKVIFEIQIDPQEKETVPFSETDRNKLLIWFGARFRLNKIEFVEQNSNESLWVFGLSLRPTLHSQTSVRKLFEFYEKKLSDLKDLHHALARILIYKGLYGDAMIWLQKGDHNEELAELAIRRAEYDQAEGFLAKLPEDSDDAKLLRAFLLILKSNDTINKGRALLTEICAEATDRLVRARANIGLGFLSLTVASQTGQAFDQFKAAHDVLAKFLPENHPDVAKSLIGLGYAQYTSGDVTSAKKTFDNILEKQKLVLPNEHPDLAKTYAALARCDAHENQRLKDAVRRLDSASTILSRTFFYEQKYHPEILGNRFDLKQLQNGRPLRAKLSLLDYI